jgi:threonyl-tRNA synthetase
LHPSDVFIGFLLDNNSGGLPFWIQGKQVTPVPVTIEKLSGGPVWSIYQIGDSAVIREVENVLPAFLTNVEWISILT